MVNADFATLWNHICLTQGTNCTLSTTTSCNKTIIENSVFHSELLLVSALFSHPCLLKSFPFQEGKKTHSFFVASSALTNFFRCKCIQKSAIGVERMSIKFTPRCVLSYFLATPTPRCKIFSMQHPGHGVETFLLRLIFPRTNWIPLLTSFLMLCLSVNSVIITFKWNKN